MSILKKLFGSDEVAKGPAHPFKVRAARVPIENRHAVLFTVADSGRVIHIENLSVGGLALTRETDQALKVDQVLMGKLSIKDRSFNVSMKVRHLSQEQFGLELIGENGELRKTIESYFKVEILAINLNKVDELYLKPDPRGRVLWYTDGFGNEVYCIQDDKGLVHMHTTFFGNYIEGGRDSAWRSGILKDSDDGDLNQSAAIKRSQILELSEPTAEMRALTRVFIQNVEKMPEPLKEEILRKLA